jgi:hypothetical protein
MAIGKKTIFTSSDINYLKENYLRRTNKQLATHLGKKLTVVRNKMYELGLARYNQKERAWADWEDSILIANYKDTGDVQLAKMIGREKGGVRKRRITLNLIRTVAQINAIVETNLTKFKKTSFKPGNKSTPNPVKAWQTRRERDNMSQEQIMRKIDHAAKANFYRA